MLRELPHNSAEELQAIMKDTPQEWSLRVPWPILGNIETVMVQFLQWNDVLSAEADSLHQSSRSNNCSKDRVAHQVNLEDKSDEEATPRKTSCRGEESEDEAVAMQVGQRPYKPIGNSQARTSGMRRTERSRLYAFPKHDEVKAHRKPQQPCQVCGSEYHWRKECPCLSAYEAAEKAGKLDKKFVHVLSKEYVHVLSKEYEDQEDEYLMDKLDIEWEGQEAQAF